MQRRQRQPTASQATDVFPVTIKSAFGDVAVAAKPERVVTWGWSAQEVGLDLGVVPVGMPSFRYDGGDDGILPWTKGKVEELGVPMPAILPEAAQPPVEAIAALDPDVIIAPYRRLCATGGRGDHHGGEWRGHAAVVALGLCRGHRQGGEAAAQVAP